MVMAWMTLGGTVPPFSETFMDFNAEFGWNLCVLRLFDQIQLILEQI